MNRSQNTTKVHSDSTSYSQWEVCTDNALFQVQQSGKKMVTVVVNYQIESTRLSVTSSNVSEILRVLHLKKHLCGISYCELESVIIIL